MAVNCAIYFLHLRWYETARKQLTIPSVTFWNRRSCIFKFIHKKEKIKKYDRTGHQMSSNAEWGHVIKLRNSKVGVMT